MRDGDVFERDIEFASAPGQLGLYPGRNGFSLSDELRGIELGDDCFEDFVSDGGEDTLVVVLSEVLLSAVSARSSKVSHS